MNLSGGLVAGLILVVAGIGFYSLAQDEQGIEASLFGGEPTPLCLHLDGQDDVNGTIVGQHILPGSTVSGEILLTHCDPADPDALDLDIDFRLNATDAFPPSNPSFAEMLIISSLFYGADNLLATDPLLEDDRNLLIEIDMHPTLGNADGRLSLHEARAGVNDLPTPAVEGEGTPFWISVTLAEEATNDLQGDDVDVTIVFQLSDVLHGDLN